MFRTSLQLFMTLLAFVFLIQTFSAQSYAQSCQMLFNEGASAKKSFPLKNFEATFGTKSPIIGMIHLAGESNTTVVQRALAELALFEELGVHAAIIENYHGTLQQVELVLKAAQGRFPKLILGVNVLPNSYEIAFPLAQKYGAKFIQLDFISGKYESFNDPIELNSKNYYKYRKAYSDILVLGGVHPKYYQPVEHSNLRRDLRTAQLRADAVVVTGSGTGKETPFEKIRLFREILGSKYPLVIGAGVTVENAHEQLSIGNGAIIGSYFKNGNTAAPLIKSRILDILKLIPTEHVEEANE